MRDTATLLSEKYEKAKDKLYCNLRKQKHNSAITAMILLEYIEDFNKEILLSKK